MFRLVLAVLALAIGLISGTASAQTNAPVYSTGVLTPGHGVVLLQNQTPGSAAIVGDAGPALAGNYTEIGITNTGLPFCIRDSVGPGYHIFCLGANSLGGGLLTYSAQGGASPLPLQFSVNGQTYQFPFAVGGIVGPNPSVVGQPACWNNMQGTALGNCGSVKANSATYQAQSTDCSNHLSAAGNAFYPITFGAAAGYNPGCTITVSNDEPFPGRGKTIVITGSAYTNPILQSGQTITLTNLGSAWSPSQITPKRWGQVTPGGATLSALFVSLTGNDSNDGLGGCGGAGAPFATLNAAYTYMLQNMDLRGVDPAYIVMCTGTYNGDAQQLHAAGLMNSHNGDLGVTITGELSNYNGTGTCNNKNGATILMNAATFLDVEEPYNVIYVQCISVGSTGPGGLFSAQRNGTLYLGDQTVINGTDSGGGTPGDIPQINVNYGGHVRLHDGTIYIAHDGNGHGAFLSVGNGGEFTAFSGTSLMLLAGNYSWANFIQASKASYVDLSSVSFPGPGLIVSGGSGQLANIQSNSSIFTGSNSFAFIPNTNPTSVGFILGTGSCYDSYCGTTGPLELYAAPGGVDTNTTCQNQSAPCSLPNACAVRQRINTAISGGATINLTAGTYSPTPDSFGAYCTILGNSGGSALTLTRVAGAGYASTTISLATGATGFYVKDGGELQLQDVSIGVAGTGANAIYSAQAAVVDVQGTVQLLTFDNASTFAQLGNTGMVNLIGTILVGPSFNPNMFVYNNGGYLLSTATITFNNAASFHTAFIYNNGSRVSTAGTTINGAGLAGTTGPKYVGVGGCLFTGGAHPNSGFPGSVNGSVPSNYCGDFPTATAVSLLPAAGSNQGRHYSVSDATAVTFGSIVAGGGTNTLGVTSDGTNWREQ